MLKFFKIFKNKLKNKNFNIQTYTEAAEDLLQMNITDFTMLEKTNPKKYSDAISKFINRHGKLGIKTSVNEKNGKRYINHICKRFEL